MVTMLNLMAYDYYHRNGGDDDGKSEDDDDDDVNDDGVGNDVLFVGYKPTYVGVRVPPCKKFVWNEYLLKNVVDVLQYDWLLYIIHGFVGQSSEFF